MLGREGVCCGRAWALGTGRGREIEGERDRGGRAQRRDGAGCGTRARLGLSHPSSLWCLAADWRGSVQAPIGRGVAGWV